MSAKPIAKDVDLKKPDPVEKALYALADRIYRQRQLYIGIAVAVVVLILAGWGLWKYQEAQQIERANLYHAAEKILRDPTLAPADRMARGKTALEHVAGKIEEGLLAVVIRLELGTMHLQSGELDAAERRFEEAKNLAQSSPFLRNVAHLNLAKLHASQDRWDNAYADLKQISGDTWGDVKLREQAIVALEQGDLEAARTTLEELINTVPNSMFRDEAELLLISL